MDLQQIHDYVAKDSKYYARKVVGTIVEKSEELGDFPEIGRIVPEINDQIYENCLLIHIV